MATKASLTHDLSWYLPNNISLELRNSPGSVRKEYSRLRDIQQKRIKRLKSAGYDDIKAYKMNANHYPKLKDIKSNQELSQRLSDLARFIYSDTTVGRLNRIRDKALATLHENHYTFVTKENFKEFGQFMEEYRAQKLDEQGYDSGDAAEVYGFTLKHDLDPEEVKKDFQEWLDNIEGARALRRSKKSAGDYTAMKKRAINKTKQFEKEADGE